MNNILTRAEYLQILNEAKTLASLEFPTQFINHLNRFYSKDASTTFDSKTIQKNLYELIDKHFTTKTKTTVLFNENSKEGVYVFLFKEGFTGILWSWNKAGFVNDNGFMFFDKNEFEKVIKKFELTEEGWTVYDLQSEEDLDVDVRQVLYINVQNFIKKKWFGALRNLMTFFTNPTNISQFNMDQFSPKIEEGLTNLWFRNGNKELQEFCRNISSLNISTNYFQEFENSLTKEDNKETKEFTLESNLEKMLIGIEAILKNTETTEWYRKDMTVLNKESFHLLTGIDESYYYYVSASYLKLIHLLRIIEENSLEKVIDLLKKSMEKLNREKQLDDILKAIL